MKRILLILLAFHTLPGTICMAGSLKSATETITVPLGGNGWLSKNSTAKIDKKGLTNWASPADVISIYFRTEAAGDASLSLKLSMPHGKSRISVTAEGNTFTKELSTGNAGIINIGTVRINKPGYVKIELRGISKTGAVFADVTDLIVSGPSLEKGAAYVKNNEGNYFYWGHRGPSVHLKYEIPPAAGHIEWFYNEISVPVGQDKLGTYYMANGFSGGYFGMQVNSATERRVLFSVWSPFTTDDPKAIPDSMKIVLLKKGSSTHTGEFGNEGSGGQSYMKYPWNAGKTYAFLLRAQPNQRKNTTIYTAYFKEADKGDWQLVASFERPQSAVYLKGLHSFLENFSPATGDQERKGNYKNQWIADSTGTWHELTGATFTVDATARINYRKDYAGGTENSSFYLRNCGFFNDFTPKDSKFERKPAAKLQPRIDFSRLP